MFTLGAFVFKHPYIRFVAVNFCSAYIFATSQEKAQTHLSPKKEFCISCLNMLVFTVIMPLPSSPCLLHHWTMWPFSQWNLILLMYTQECFSPGEWRDKLAVLWLFLKCISLRHCLPWFSYRNAFHTSCQNEHTPFFPEWTLKSFLQKFTRFFVFFP